MAMLTLVGWERLQDVFYRKRAEYSMMWVDDIDLSEFIVVGAPYGGAIGVSSSLLIKRY